MRRWPLLVLGAVLVGSGLTLGAGIAAAVTTKSGPATAIEGTLAREGADGVVILGNSKVSTDLDLVRLRAALGPDAPTVAPANVYGTSAPVWYAVLKNRVYANGHRPKLLVVFAPLETALTRELPAELSRAVLGAQLGEEEPVVAAKVFGGAFGPDVRERLRRLLLPACHPDRPAAAPATKAGPDGDVEDTFLADILTLAKEHGTPTVVVRAPMGPSRTVQDDVPPERIADTVLMIMSRGAGWIDLSAGAPEAAFGDGVHMNVAGRRHMTDVLAEALRPVLAGGPLPMEGVAPALRLGVLREGPTPTPLPLAVVGPGEGCARVVTHPLLATLGAPALRAAGLGPIAPLVPRQGKAALRVAPAPPKPTDCTGMYTASAGTLQIAAYAAQGEAFELVASPELPLHGPGGEEAWWVYPGTTLRVGVVPVGAGTPVTVATRSVGATPSTGAAEPTVTLGGRPLSRDGGTAVGGETELAVSSPANGPWVLVERVRIGPFDVLGGDEPLHLDLLAGPATYGRPPPALPAMGTGTPTSPEGTTLRLDLPPGVPDDELAFVRSGHGRCAPLEVLRDGVPVDDLDVLPTSRGLLLTSRDCAPVGARAEALTWRLDPDRACRTRDGARWLYPGDDLTLSTEVRAPLAGAARTLRLELGGALVGPVDPAGTLSIDVRVDGARWSTVKVPLGAFESVPPTVLLPSRRLREGSRVEVRFAASSGTTWLVLTSARLTETSAAVPSGPWQSWASR